jgi:hypothetical protein
LKTVPIEVTLFSDGTLTILSAGTLLGPPTRRKVISLMGAERALTKGVQRNSVILKEKAVMTINNIFAPGPTCPSLIGHSLQLPCGTSRS